MQSQQTADGYQSQARSTYHPLTFEDAAVMASLRAIVEPNKGRMQGTAARKPFDAIMERVAVPEGVRYEAGTVGGVPGLWCNPAVARPGEVVLHLHGGWFNSGTAHAFRRLVGHIAAGAGVQAFVPDYRLAPEHLFPAATRDVRACYLDLVASGYSKIAVTGDSADGNLALGLIAVASSSKASDREALVGSVLLSPVTDLSLFGESWTTQAAADPYFTRPQVTELVRLYLAGHDATDPIVSPLRDRLAGWPPVRVHVGSDEVLFNDSIDFVARAVAAGVDAQVDVWEGMVHGFLGGIGRMAASDAALRQISAFLTERFRWHATTLARGIK